GRAELLDRQGCDFVFMVAPDNHSVYPENLPPGTEHASVRPVHQLMTTLEETGSRIRVVYPLEEMAAGKDAGLVCSRIDTHWSDTRTVTPSSSSSLRALAVWWWCTRRASIAAC